MAADIHINPEKPLGRKSYGSIAHLSDSRLGPGDHHCHEGQERICTVKARDKHDRIIVTEKVDGSNVGVAKINGIIVPIIRAGYRAVSSNYEQHRLFHDWVMGSKLEMFMGLLSEGERACGEWLALAHGTRYDLRGRLPFVVFDVMQEEKRAPWDDVVGRCTAFGIPTVHVISDGPPLSVTDALAMVEPSHHGALDPVEGCVWRVERSGKFDFMAKYVRPDKQDGKYFTEVSGSPEVWNWRPA